MSHSHQVRTLALAGLLGILLGAVCRGAPANWAIPEAPLRYTVSLESRPSHSSCGYFLHIPDGGILPKTYPHIQVVASDGSTIPSYVMWHNSRSGIALVISDPGTRGDLHVYIGKSQKSPALWTPETGLTPSAILCTDPDGTSVAQARKLATMGPVGPRVHYVNKAGLPVAPLSIGGDETGRPLPASFYLLSYIATKDPGNTWIAPFTLNGTHTVHVNGQVLEPVKRIDKWGGKGQYFDLPKGLNRIEVFASASTPLPPQGKKNEGGIMYLTLRTPKATMEELGGKRSNKVPMQGTSRMETRVFKDEEIARSGNCRISQVETKNGSPVAYVIGTPSQNYWFEGEEPQILYQFNALTMGHPKGTKYRWDFGQGQAINGPNCAWLIPGFKEGQVTLSIAAGKSRSQCTFPFYGYSTQQTSLNNPYHRREYRQACQSMLESAPAHMDPTTTWSDSAWANLFRTLDYGKGYYLLHHLFTKRWNRAAPRIRPDRLYRLQDALLDVVPRQNPGEAMQFARTFRQRSTSGQRKNEMILREAEIAMFYLGKTNSVQQVFEQVVSGGGEAAERARIRLGDLALIRGDLNQATKFYSGVQHRVKLERNNPGSSDPGSAGPNSLRAGQIGNWKLSALLDVSAAEQVKTQIEQGYLLEASQTLSNWERQFPLSKINGDFILQEARLYMATSNHQRAIPMLKAYCYLMDASSFLPDCAKALLECMVGTEAPEAEIQAFARDMKERLKFHPAADRFEAELTP